MRVSERLRLAYIKKRQEKIKEQVREINKVHLDRQLRAGEGFMERRGLKGKMPKF